MLENEIAVAANTATSHAFDHRHLDRRIVVRWVPVMADKIVAGRNVKMGDFHSAHDNIEKLVSHERKRDRFAKNYPSKTRRRTGISTGRSHNRGAARDSHWAQGAGDENAHHGSLWTR